MPEKSPGRKPQFRHPDRVEVLCEDGRWHLAKVLGVNLAGDPLVNLLEPLNGSVMRFPDCDQVRHPEQEVAP